LSLIRVLTVDDFEPCRDIVRSILAASTDVEVIGEACDGPEAIQKAEQFRPEVILLDITLPGLNGIQIARELRKRVPECKILFFSQHDSPSLVRAALNTGAHGYVLKREAALELVPAVEAIASNRHFISRSLTGSGLSETTHPPAL